LESLVAYDNALGCEYEGMIMRPNNASCGYIERVCQNYPDLVECTMTRFLEVPDNSDPTNCERSVPDFCLKPYVEQGWMGNGTRTQGNRLSCYEIKPLSDFRVTKEDQERHHFDKDYDGIGCENNTN
jgi:hypothetical protein